MILYGHDEQVAAWVSHRLENLNFGTCRAIGIARGEFIIAGVVFNNYYISPLGVPISIEATISTVEKTWATRHTLLHIFAYPFIHLNVKRLQATVQRKNKANRRFLERLGFRLEGIARQAWHSGGDAAAYSMLKHECRWIINNGEKFPLSRPGSRSECSIGGANAIESADGAL